MSASTRWGINARQSHGKETSVEDQVRIGTARCAREGGMVFREYRDKVSASRFATRVRTDWPQLVEDVTEGRLGVVWLWDTSRGDRTPESWFAFLSGCRQRGVLIYVERDERAYDARKPRDWKSLADAGVDAAYEPEVRSVDTRRGIAGAALNGKAHGRPAHGYTRIYDVNDRKKYTELPDEHAPVASEIIERIASGDPISHIVTDLNERGAWTPAAVKRARSGKNTQGPVCERGCRHESCMAIRGKWVRHSVRLLAQCPTYAGFRGHHWDPKRGGPLHRGNWEPIVSETVWRSAVAVLADPSRKAAPPGATKWLLSYLGRAHCGEHLNHRLRHPRSFYGCAEDGCTGIGVWELDEHITNVVLAWLARPNARRLYVVDDEQAARAQAEVTAINEELLDLGRRLGAGKISGELAAVAEPDIRARLRKAEERFQATTANGALLALLGNDEEVTEEILRPRWDMLSVAARRSVIGAVTEEIRVHRADERLSRWSPDEDRLRLAAERTEIRWRGQRGDA